MASARRLQQLGQLAQPLEAVAAPGRAVDDESIGALEAGRCAGRARERRLAGPPDRHRQVVDEQRRRDRRRGAGRPRRRRSGGSSRRTSRGRPRRGRTQCASIRASSHDGPSGSADWMTIVRDGCRPVSGWIVAAQCSASSGRRATTTRFITLVRAAMWRPDSPSIVDRQVLGGPDPGQLGLDLGDAVGARTTSAGRVRRA